VQDDQEILTVMKKAKRHICLVTGSRADYGLLHNLARAVQEDPDLQLQLIATGSHLSPTFGLTLKEIEADGFVPAATVDMLVASDRASGIARSIALGTIGMADAFERLKPDLIVVLGDRFEILAAVQAALVSKIPVAHIHGGEATRGAVDDAIRHAITKMSHLHFTSTEEYRNRVIQLGESPDSVWNVGAPVVDSLKRLKLLSRHELTEEFQFNFLHPYFLVTYHPTSYGNLSPSRAVAHMFEALSKFQEYNVVVSGTNADAGNSELRERIFRAISTEPQRMHFCESFGHLRYLSAMSQAVAVIGNSSSGVIEAPALGIPSVNIGNRQAGRVRAVSVIDTPEDAESIARAILKALSTEFALSISARNHPFGDGHSTERILEILKNVPIQSLLEKTFHDFTSIT
jgi:UDP-N-acetylglucosamine 2-epimerase (non-hydrolysing)/GDP/UDP-N,N'-diacetylbacillosamine 2-epimerase (hydrolysing)